MLMQFSSVVAGRLLASATQALTIVLLARWSPPEQFGLVITVQALLGFLSVMIGLGFPQYIGVLRARERESSAVAEIFHFNRRTGWIASVVCMVVLAVLGSLDSVFLILLPLALALGFEHTSNSWDRVAVADGQIRLFSFNLVLRRVLTLLVFLATYHFAGQAIVGYCTGVLLSQVVYNALMRHKGLFIPGKKTKGDIRPVFSESKHFWVDSMSGMLRQLDVAAAGLVLGPVASGYFSVPSRIASPLMLMPTSFATLILPLVSAGREKAARHGVYLAVSVTALIAIVLMGLSPFLDELTGLALGESYLPAVPVTRIYFISFVGLSLIYMLGAVLQGLGFHSVVGRNSLAFSVLSIALLCAGGYFYGLEAAAWGYVAGTLGQVLGLVYLFVFRERVAARRSERLRAAAPARTTTGMPTKQKKGNVRADESGSQSHSQR
jgi:O-antigen/teichoic acid export membrane protein